MIMMDIAQLTLSERKYLRSDSLVGAMWNVGSGPTSGSIFLLLIFALICYVLVQCEARCLPKARNRRNGFSVSLEWCCKVWLC